MTINAIHHSPILHVDFAINRFFRLTIIFIFLLFGLSVFSNKANAVEVVIEGATGFVCPNKSVTYTARTYEETFGNEVNTCNIAWDVYKGIEIVGGIW